VNRRRLLAAGLAAGVTGLAGCSAPVRTGAGRADDASGTDAGTTTSTPTATGTATATPSSGTAPVPSLRDVELPVPEEELDRGAAKDGIPAVLEPAFGADWSDVDAVLADESRVVGVVRDGEARAYPLRVLNWHEVVNDEFDVPVLVTYCPLCGSGVVAERLVGGEPTPFGVSGLLWHSDLVMYDRATGSLWSQILATAIRGERTGDRLTLLPSSLATWGEWREAHPGTSVLLPPPASGTVHSTRPRDYSYDPYAGYDETDQVGVGYNEFDDDRLHAKRTVLGVFEDDVARAYPLGRVREAGVVNDAVGGLPVVVAATTDDSLVAYVRRVDGETVTFERPGGTDRLAAAGSTWDLLTGEATAGPHEGTVLARANDRSPMFWFAWAEFHPATEVYGAASS
jgi:hypothetical protein